MAAAGIKLNHIARESPDVKRLAAFYQEVLGFERLETPNFGNFDVIWLRLPPDFSLHIIERDPQSRLPEGPHGSPPERAVADPRGLPRGHHISFGVSNYDQFVKSLKERGIETFEKTQPDGKTRQVFFFDPDGTLNLGIWSLMEAKNEGIWSSKKVFVKINLAPKRQFTEKTAPERHNLVPKRQFTEKMLPSA